MSGAPVHLSELLSDQKKLPLAEVAGYAEPVRLSAANGPDPAEMEKGLRVNSAKLGRELEVTMKRPGESASRLIDEKIKELGDWRGKTLAKVREIIHEADPEIVEEWKWAKPTNPGTPVWSHGGILSTAGDGGAHSLDWVRSEAGTERRGRKT